MAKKISSDLEKISKKFWNVFEFNSEIRAIPFANESNLEFSMNKTLFGLVRVNKKGNKLLLCHGSLRN